MAYPNILRTAAIKAGNLTTFWRLFDAQQISITLVYLQWANKNLFLKYPPPSADSEIVLNKTTTLLFSVVSLIQIIFFHLTDIFHQVK